MDTLKFEIPGKPEYLRMVRLAISSVAATAGFDVEEIDDLKNAVCEACKNVSCHGFSGFSDLYEIELKVDPHYMHSTGIPRFFQPGCDAVLELKCPCSQVPYWMFDLIKFLNLKHGAFSKFGNAAAEWKRVYENPRRFKTPYWTKLAVGAGENY